MVVSFFQEKMGVTPMLPPRVTPTLLTPLHVQAAVMICDRSQRRHYR